MSARREMVGDKRRIYQIVKGRVRIKGGWLYFDTPHRIEVEQTLDNCGDWETSSYLDYENAEPVVSLWGRFKAFVCFWRRPKLPQARLLK